MTDGTIKSRLAEFGKVMGFKGFTAFEASCGFVKNTIKETGVTTNTLLRIVEKYPQINLDWLILGRGEMLIGGEMPAKAPNLPQNRTEQPKAINYPSVSVQNVQAVFVTNWQDVASVVEQTVKNVMGKQ